VISNSIKLDEAVPGTQAARNATGLDCPGAIITGASWTSSVLHALCDDGLVWTLSIFVCVVAQYDRRKTAGE
jgi:hypothetical protein